MPSIKGPPKPSKKPSAPPETSSSAITRSRDLHPSFAMQKMPLSWLLGLPLVIGPWNKRHPKFQENSLFHRFNVGFRPSPEDPTRRKPWIRLIIYLTCLIITVVLLFVAPPLLSNDLQTCCHPDNHHARSRMSTQQALTLFGPCDGLTTLGRHHPKIRNSKGCETKTSGYLAVVIMGLIFLGITAIYWLYHAVITFAWMHHENYALLHGPSPLDVKGVDALDVYDERYKTDVFLIKLFLIPDAPWTAIFPPKTKKRHHMLDILQTLVGLTILFFILWIATVTIPYEKYWFCCKDHNYDHCHGRTRSCVQDHHFRPIHDYSRHAWSMIGAAVGLSTAFLTLAYFEAYYWAKALMSHYKSEWQKELKELKAT